MVMKMMMMMMMMTIMMTITMMMIVMGVDERIKNSSEKKSSNIANSRSMRHILRGSLFLYIAHYPRQVRIATYRVKRILNFHHY